jgi:hypothetical protein
MTEETPTGMTISTKKIRRKYIFHVLMKHRFFPWNACPGVRESAARIEGDIDQPWLVKS